jgi:hypothetical protein
MMKKYLDKQGLQHFAEEIAARVGSGGGGSAAGRIKKVGTAENPINLNHLNEPNSYLLSGVFDLDSFPPDMSDLQDVPDAVLCFDVAFKAMTDMDDGYIGYVLTKSIQFMSFMSITPAMYSALFILDIYEEPLLPGQEDGKLEDGFVKLDDLTYIQLFNNKWSLTSLSNVPEKIIRQLQTENGNAVTLDMLLYYDGPNEEEDETPRYEISFTDSLLKDSDYIEDMIFATGGQYELYPHFKFSSFITMAALTSNVTVNFVLNQFFDENDGYTYSMGTVEFPSKNSRDFYMTVFNQWYVSIVYTTNTAIVG